MKSLFLVCFIAQLAVGTIVSSDNIELHSVKELYVEVSTDRISGVETFKKDRTVVTLSYYALESKLGSFKASFFHKLDDKFSDAAREATCKNEPFLGPGREFLVKSATQDQYLLLFLETGTDKITLSRINKVGENSFFKASWHICIRDKEIHYLIEQTVQSSSPTK
jgi:hypothetical protein